MEEKLQKLLGWSFIKIEEGLYKNVTGEFETTIDTRKGGYIIKMAGGVAGIYSDEELVVYFNKLRECALMNQAYDRNLAQMKANSYNTGSFKKEFDLADFVFIGIFCGLAVLFLLFMVASILICL